MNIIRDKKQEIMTEWQNRVTHIIPAAKAQSKLALYDSLPDYLENLSRLLYSEDQSEKDIAEGKEDLIGKVHGQHRANSSYSISQMVEEYVILKDVVVDVLKEHNLYDLELAERINSSFQKTLQTSVAQFSKSLLDSQENFVTSLAHDLRNPLMVIKMQAELMIRKGQYAQNYCDKIVSSANKVDDMIEHLLTTIRSQHMGFNETDSSEFDLREMILKVMDDYEETYAGIIKVEGPKILVRWNAHAMERVIDNLISNSVKYGDVTLPITVRLRNDDKTVFFSIHNFGEPIPAEEQVHLFQKFKRLENSKLKKGWGIGLNFVKSVVESHKGIVLVHSDEKGTEFKFEIPKDVGESQMVSLSALRKPQKEPPHLST